jgi:hypothetical protein
MQSVSFIYKMPPYPHENINVRDNVSGSDHCVEHSSVKIKDKSIKTKVKRKK